MFRRCGESRSKCAAFGSDATGEIQSREPQECSLALPTSPRQRRSGYGIFLGNTGSSTLRSFRSRHYLCPRPACIVLGAGLDPGRATHVRAGLRFVQCFAFCSSRSPSSPSPSPRRPLLSLPAWALQPAPSFLRDEAGCMQRSRGCMWRLHWSRPSWFCFAPRAATRPTSACLRLCRCQASRPAWLQEYSKISRKPHNTPHRHAEEGKTRWRTPCTAGQRTARLQTLRATASAKQPTHISALGPQSR